MPRFLFLLLFVLLGTTLTTAQIPRIEGPHLQGAQTRARDIAPPDSDLPFVDVTVLLHDKEGGRQRYYSFSHPIIRGFKANHPAMLSVLRGDSEEEKQAMFSLFEQDAGPEGLSVAKYFFQVCPDLCWVVLTKDGILLSYDDEVLPNWQALDEDVLTSCCRFGGYQLGVVHYLPNSTRNWNPNSAPPKEVAQRAPHHKRQRS